MKETEKSLKIYFYLLGIGDMISAIMYYLNVFTGTTDINEKIIKAFIILMFMLFSIMYINYGIKLKKYLKKSPKALKVFIIITSIVNGIFFITLSTLSLIIVPLLAWYLIHNIQRLSKQLEGVSNNNK